MATCLYSMAVDRLDASLADLAAATEIHPVRFSEVALRHDRSREAF
jgi:hypothetical protein